MLRKFADLLLGTAKVEEEDKPNLLPVAVCVILLEAAWADQEFTDNERKHINRVLRQRFEIEDEDAEHLIHQAMGLHTESTSLFRFTSRLNDAFSQEEKIAILEEVWRIIYSDGTLNNHEDHLAHQLRNMLNLNHKQFIDAKMIALEEFRRGQSSPK